MPLPSTVVNLEDADGDIFPFTIYMRFVEDHRPSIAAWAWHKLREAESNGHTTFRHPGRIHSFEYDGTTIVVKS